MLLIWRQLSFIFLIFYNLDGFQRYCFATTNGYDPYEILEVRRTSTQDEIRQAYKRLVKKWHPDKNKAFDSENRFLEVNKAYKILSNIVRRELYDKTGLTEDHLSDDKGYEQLFREQQRFQFQYVRWTGQRQKHDLINFIFPFVSVLGTLIFIFLIGFILNKIKIDMSEQNSQAKSTNRNESKKQNPHEWHEDTKAPLTEEEKLQRIQSRIWRLMSPLLHELRAETQFGLIRLLKPGCRSIIVLVDAESKETLLQQFSRHVYFLRNNKTFSFGFLVIPKNLNWFRSLLELTLPNEQKGDSSSVTTDMTITTDTNSLIDYNCISTEKMKVIDEKASLIGTFEKCKKEDKELTIKNRLKNINTKHTIGTVLVLCGWRLYFSIYHPMHRDSNCSRNNIQLEALGDDDMDDAADQCIGGKGTANRNSLRNRNKVISSIEENKQTGVANVENVLNGFPIFLERLLEGTIRRYYIPEWPENLT